MEDKRCPVCKKYNPPGEDTCLFCGNSLDPGEITSPAAYSGEDMEVPDWLKDFKENSESGQPDAANPPDHNEPVDHTPDWLQRIRDLNENNLEGRPSYSESIGPVSEDAPDEDTLPVNPSGLQEWLNKLHRLEIPKERPGIASDRSPVTNPETIPPISAVPEKPRDDEVEFSGDYVEEILSDELTAAPEQDMNPLEGASEAKEGQEFENLAVPVEIQEESLMVEMNDYKSQAAETGGNTPGLSEPADTNEIGSSGPRSWMQKITALFSGISFLKANKSAAAQKDVPGEEVTLSGTEPEIQSAGAADEANSAFEETIPPFGSPEYVSGESEGVDLQVEEGQKELALSAGLLDAPGNIPGSLPDAESKEIPAVGQPAAQDSSSSPEIMGAVQGDEVVTQFTPAARADRLINLTEKQRAHRDLLQDLIREELEPRELPEKQGKLTNRLLRWLIALIVITGVAFPLVTAGTVILPAFVMPASPQQQSFYQEIEAMPDNSTVLVAFDYEAAFSGEMRPIAVNVIEHLIKKKATLAFVSTLPAGAIMAEDVYAQAVLNSGVTGLESDDKYVNLGYMPGGVASLRQFSILPKQASPYGLKSAIDKQPSWTKPALQALSSLSDFSIVIVMTDNIETGRAWLEQVQPALLETPLLLVTSAQAGPVVNPYLFSGQAQGMVSGYAGNLAYEQLLNKGSGNPSAFMAYRSGMYLLLVALIIGGFLKIYNSILSRKSNVQGKGSM